MISGGGCIRAEVLRFFNHLGYHLSNGYGMTEIGITSVELSDCPAILNSGSIGSPVASVEYRITETGELLVRGTSMAAVLIENGVRKELSGTEWFETKDLAAERDGRYFIAGRQDDLIVAPNGENLNPNRLEENLKVPGITGVCLTSIEKNGSRVPLLLYGIPAETGEEEFQALKKKVYEKVSAENLSEAVEKIAFVTEPLIRGQEFKLNRRRLSEDYANGELRLYEGDHSDPENVRNEITETVRKAFAEALGKNPEEVGYTTDFFLDEGGSSLDFFAVLSSLTETFRIPFPIEEGKTSVTMKEMCDYIESQLENGNHTF